MPKKTKHYGFYVRLSIPSGSIKADTSANAKRAIRKMVKTYDINKLIHKIKVWEIPKEDYEIYGLK